MNASGRGSQSRSSSRAAALVAAVLALGPITPGGAAAEPEVVASLQDGMTAELSLAVGLAQRDDPAGADESAQALGVQARFGGSFYAVVTRSRPRGPGLRIRDAWAVGFGTGLQRGYTESSLGFSFRIEAALRPVYQVNPELDLFGRAGYLVGYDRFRGHPGCFSGNDCVGYDGWLLTAGARAGKLFVEAGLAWAGKAQSGDYRMATVQYRLRPRSMFTHVGLHYEGVAAASMGDPSMHIVRLVFGSH